MKTYLLEIVTSLLSLLQKLIKAGKTQPSKLKKLLDSGLMELFLTAGIEDMPPKDFAKAVLSQASKNEQKKILSKSLLKIGEKFFNRALAVALQRRKMNNEEAAIFLGLSKEEFIDWLENRKKPEHLNQELVKHLYLLTRKLPQEIWPGHFDKLTFSIKPSITKELIKIKHGVFDFSSLKDNPKTWRQETYESVSRAVDLNQKIRPDDYGLTLQGLMCLRLRFIEKLSYTEIGKQLAVTEERVRSYLFKALIDIHHQIEKGTL